MQRFTVLIDALYEHKVKLFCTAQAAPGELATAGRSAFARVASRLAEMQSAGYLALPHRAE
jgi:cell division protein ZapE